MAFVTVERTRGLRGPFDVEAVSMLTARQRLVMAESGREIVAQAAADLEKSQGQQAANQERCQGILQRMMDEGIPPSMEAYNACLADPDTFAAEGCAFGVANLCEGFSWFKYPPLKNGLWAVGGFAAVYTAFKFLWGK